MMQNGIARFVKDRSGVTSIEYALIAVIAAVGMIASVPILGKKVRAARAKYQRDTAEKERARHRLWGKANLATKRAINSRRNASG